MPVLELCTWFYYEKLRLDSSDYFHEYFFNIVGVDGFLDFYCLVTFVVIQKWTLSAQVERYSESGKITSLNMSFFDTVQ